MRLKKHLGQHHLRQAAVCRPLLEYLQPRNRGVLEIGPGGGVLTAALVESGGRVTAWELDLEWALALRQSARLRSVVLVVGDALDIEWGRLPRGTLVAGNLPYGISTALIERLLPHWNLVPRAGFLVQKEVAERLVAGPGDKQYGALSVLTAARAEVRILGRVARGSFHPVPRVAGAFVGLDLQPPPASEAEMRRFSATVRLGFAKRRKLLRNALAAGWGVEEAERAMAEAYLGRQVRAEELGLPEFLRLHAAHEEAND
jgi:16S rRNA (adenine1518-N6/adenine1519-N6)-dimethyltransferase